MVQTIHDGTYIKQFVMPDPGSSPGQALIRHPVLSWIPAFAGMTVCTINFDAVYKSRKLTFVAIIAVIWLSLADAPPVFGQPSQARVAVLTPGGMFAPVHEGLKEGLARLGYKEGQNINYILEDTRGSTTDLTQRLAKLLAAEPNVIFTVATVHSLAAKQATATVPIVFAWVGDPDGTRLIAGYASSQNNVTGVSTFAAPLSGKRLEVLLEVAPKIKRVLVIVTSTNSFAVNSYKFLEGTAKKLGVQLVRRDVANKEEVERALRETRKGAVDAFFYVPSVLLTDMFALFVNKAKTEKIPLVVHDDFLTAKGALFSYGQNSREAGMQAATLVDKVLKGVKPRDIVIETPNKLFLAVNLTTAKEIRLNIPRSILERSDHLIE